jgi:hypothetical protein
MRALRTNHCRRLVIGVAAATALVAAPLLASAENGSDAVASARTARDQAAAGRRTAEARLAEAQTKHDAAHRELEAAAANSGLVVEQLRVARAAARQHAVDAYVHDGSAERLGNLLHSAGPSDASIRTAYLTVGATQAARAADTYEALKEQIDPKLVALVTAADKADAELDSALSDLTQAGALESDAERALSTARAAAAAAAAAKQSTTTPTTTAPPAKADAVAPPPAPQAPVPAPRPVVAVQPKPTVSGVRPDMAEQWAKLRHCESSGNYQAVSASGRYRGAYQFDTTTWASIGGSGDPAAAPPEEQDMRAQKLYDQRGARPWPVCGRFLLG